MIIGLSIYIVGALISMMISYKVHKKIGFITVSDLFDLFVAALFSWLAVLIWIVIWVEDNWNKEIWRKKDEH